MAISGLVITLNEAHNIVDCLRSLRAVCDDIVVVDSGSTDGTIALAEAEGATVIVQKPFLGDGPQRSLGLPRCRHAWVLNLDADERLEPDFIAYVKNTDLDALGVDLVETRRRNYIGDRFTPYAGQYPDYVKRLFNRHRADFTPVVAHTCVKAATSTKVAVHITHYSYRNYPDMIAKCKYAEWLSVGLAKSGKKIYPWHPALHGGWAFFRHYVIKLGFLAGLDGLTLSMCKGIGSYLKYAHALELRRSGKV
ncbi:glycosyltransferase family 2 protein [Chromobacterium subtsugae]|uniref:Glycosyltransferase family 2 protein n=1 Tax=Chromobacterium subtsugae TaxID=251747 RepID=A0ABS7FFF6_9NEIS|nr:MULTISPECIES: glycosyltransferase family 2 protein [Chromobacterium]KUM02038.1 glycosyl transferase [Chromobacterium subtsugae]KZE85461.1 glycosyl transferase [Chromobacterium sp. F49]MBW7567574.1 glycosyltransferase family 2 protein [Chromobacterium subtsugae]MBW8288798.1 glycosyltransferase family 2 protein [Chromobacterium subtsugae]OBU87066.1 glycosyl transferase [Chromobacterium subtsugae]